MKEDLRITKTRKVLYETLINLMKEKSFEEIKVSDICKEALINRSTFYSHYSDKYELFLELITALKNNLFTSLNTNSNSVNTREYFTLLIELLLDHIDEKKDIYYAILIHNRNSIVIDIILDAIQKDINTRLESDEEYNKVIPNEIITKFYLGGIVSLGIEYLSSKKYSKEDMLKYIEYLIPEDIIKEAKSPFIMSIIFSFSKLIFKYLPLTKT